MLELNEALARSLTLAVPRHVQTLPLSECYGKYLAQDLIARAPLPLWDNSAMDGYAVRAVDAQAEATLTVTEVIPAGTWPQRSVGDGEAARIFTGAPLPSGADSVVIQERAELQEVNTQDRSEASRDGALGADTRVVIKETAQRGQNVRRQGEEVAQGALIARSGDRLTPGLLGLCAAQGFATLSVYQQPRVALLETGDELVSPGAERQGAQIYATHALTLAPLIAESGGELVAHRRVGDSVAEVTQALSDFARDAIELVITTGGVSVGAFDPLHEALKQSQATRVFWKVKMKPGKPLSVAKLPRPFDPSSALPIMSLPGNPVSAVVSYLLFVHPLIQRASGVPTSRLGLRRITARLTHPVDKTHERAELLRVKISEYTKDRSHEPASTQPHPDHIAWRCARHRWSVFGMDQQYRLWGWAALPTR